MHRKRSHALLSSESPDDVEKAFYEAMQEADVERMMACWADEDDVVCVHPGGMRLIGLGNIRAAFEALFEHGGLDVTASDIRRVESLTSAVHSLVERLTVQTPEGEHLACMMTTNVYQKTPQGWRMVVHHASPGILQEESVLESRPAVLH